MDGLFGWCLGRTGFGLGIEAAFSLVPPPIVILVCGSWLLGYASYFSVVDRPLLQLYFLLFPPASALFAAQFRGWAPLFGFIFACLVTQVAVGDVNSGQRVTRDSATVGGL